MKLRYRLVCYESNALSNYSSFTLPKLFQLPILGTPVFPLLLQLRIYGFPQPL